MDLPETKRAALIKKKQMMDNNFTKKRKRNRSWPQWLFLFIFLMTPATSLAENGENKFVLLIGGLGGTEEHREKFTQYLYNTRNVFLNRFHVQEDHVIVLAEAHSSTSPFVHDISRAENIQKAFSDLSTRVTDKDEVYIVLFGHGSYDGKNAKLNIPRRDLSDMDYASLVNKLTAGHIVFINTSSCSGPFIQALSAPNRTIITATRSGGERNETQFPEFFISSLQDIASDIDKNGDLSLLEVFVYASQSTIKWFADKDLLATEHALLEDTGDKRAFGAEELSNNPEGNVASNIFLLRPVRALAAANMDNEALNLLSEKEKIEEKIQQVRSNKNNMKEDIYFMVLEPLFVRLARINDQLEQAGNSAQKN